MPTTFILRAATLALILPLAPMAFAAGEHSGGHGHAASPAPAPGGHMNQTGMPGGHGHGATGAASAIGMPGRAAAAHRTVEVVMTDNAYTPAQISVRAGETVRFVLRNAGDLVHEFNINTAPMHRAHQDEMMMMMQHGALLPDRIDEDAMAAMQASMGHGMHDEPNSVLLEPGETGEVVWTFPADAEIDLQFACNVPGHYESGMVGAFRLGGDS